MSRDFEQSLRVLAEVVLRIGVNLQPGQPLLITDPYGLQGVHPETAPLTNAVRAAAGGPVNVIEANPDRLREIVFSGRAAEYEALVRGHVSRMRRHASAGGAFLFVTGSATRLFEGIAAPVVAGFERTKWTHLGPLIQSLIGGATQWTLIPGPASPWAAEIFATRPASERMLALWETIFAALRVEQGPDAVMAWRRHLRGLADRCEALNNARHRGLRLRGEGTELTMALSRSHRWCTTQLVSRKGIPFVVNLPTEEVFTAPHKNSAQGRVRVARAVTHGGAVMTGVELEFSRGRVAQARAETGGDVLEALLATDAGSRRLGEVAMVPVRPDWADGAAAERGFRHILLDENAAPHIALGDAYRFCSRAWLPLALNSSQVHVDLPLAVEVQLL